MDRPASRLVQSVAERRLLPESFLYGLAYSLGGAARRSAYLNGEVSIVGCSPFGAQV